MQTEAERTLNNLHVLAALSHNDKLMTNEDSFDIYSPTSFRGFVRMWYRENRHANISRIRNCVRSAMTFCHTSLEDTLTMGNSSSLSTSSPLTEHMQLRVSSSAMQFVRMVDAIDRAQSGLKNLLQTYRDDAASVSMVRLMMEEMDAFVRMLSTHTSKFRQAVASVSITVPLSLQSSPSSLPYSPLPYSPLES